MNDQGELRAAGQRAAYAIRDLIGAGVLAIGGGVFCIAWIFRRVPGFDLSPYAPVYAIGLFSLSAVWLWTATKKSPVLEITRNGLRWTPWSDALITWHDIAAMTARMIDGHPVLETRLIDPVRTPFRGHFSPVHGGGALRPFRGKADIIYLTNWPNCVFDDLLDSVQRFAPERLHIDDAFQQQFKPRNDRDEIGAG